MLTSIDAVLEAVGGPTAAAALAGVSLPAVSNWKSRGRIPAEKFFLFERELGSRNMQADRALFGFDGAADEARP